MANNKEILRTLASQLQGLGEAVTAALTADDLPDDATRGRKLSRNSQPQPKGAPAMRVGAGDRYHSPLLPSTSRGLQHLEEVHSYSLSPDIYTYPPGLNHLG